MKKLSARIHIWLSLPFGIIIAIVCLTGSILVFETEILELCYPSRYFVKEVKKEVLSLEILLQAARQQLPDSVKINGIRISQDPERTYQIIISGRRAAAFINPYTAEITGIDNGEGFFTQIMRLHRGLLISHKHKNGFALGKVLVGYSVLAFIFILISGLVIWYPRNKKSLKKSLSIKMRAGWFRFFYDLHVSGGFYATMFLLVMSLTGLTWSFDWYRNSFYTVFGVKTTPKQKHMEVASQTDYTQWATVLKNLGKRYPQYNSITIQDGVAAVSVAKYGNTRGNDRYTFDSSSGQITHVQFYKDLPPSGKIRGWIYSVHVGSWGGTVTRILFSLASFLGAIFAITGYYFWIRKRIRKK